MIGLERVLVHVRHIIGDEGFLVFVPYAVQQCQLLQAYKAVTAFFIELCELLAGHYKRTLVRLFIINGIYTIGEQYVILGMIQMLENYPGYV